MAQKINDAVWKMPQEAVDAALEECQRLLSLAKRKSTYGPQLSAALSKLSRQVLAALAIVQSEVATEKVEPYNPLTLGNLAETVRAKFNEQKLINLSELERFDGSGVYALYYAGDFDLYEPMAATNLRKQGSWAIYVGEAGRQAKRKGAELEPRPTAAIFNRLKKHATSIQAAKNLNHEDFWFRYLLIESLFVPLCEKMLIRTHKPLWNRLVDGFGNNPVGAPRESQQITAWDMLHPGRKNRAKKANKRFPNKKTLEDHVRKFLKGEEEGVKILPLAEAMSQARGNNTEKEA